MKFTQPLLAAKTTDKDLQNLKYPVLVSPKIDGIRAIVVDGVLVSRTLKPIRNRYTQLKFGHPSFNGLDGELVVGNPNDSGLMQATSSGVMSASGIPNVSFHVFDLWDFQEPFNTRYEELIKCVEPYIVRVPHILVHSYEELLDYEHSFISDGYEGLMVRDLNGSYKMGRSTVREGILLKVKRFSDDEAIIVGYEPLYRNENMATTDERGYTKRSSASAGKIADAMLGAFVVRRVSDGTIFNVGSGFTEMQRRDYWDSRDNLLGSTIKYKHFAVTGVKDAPRHPIFLGFRHKDDM